MAPRQPGGRPAQPPIADRPAIDEERCWQAVLNRDREADGRFLFGVVTTGVFCRPSCAARRPFRRNVRFYETAAAARADGLRPCRRCHPEADGRDEERARIEALCRFIQQHCGSGEPLTMERLAGVAGMSRSHLARTFRRGTGMTPRQFVEACRIDAFKGELRNGSAVTDAVYAAGFSSTSRLYERSEARLGMTPSAYRAGGRGMTICYALADGPLGRMLLGATDVGLCCVEFGESDSALVEWLRGEYPAADLRALPEPPPPAFSAWMAALSDNLGDTPTHPELPLAIQATAFQLRVWTFLRTIPPGTVRTYGEVAAALGRPRSARAVARACASNRLALLIPCHRVIRGDGKPGGYRWGEDRKQLLLELERAHNPARQPNGAGRGAAGAGERGG